MPILGVLNVAIGLGTLVYGLRIMALGVASRGWRATTARIIDAETQRRITLGPSVFATRVRYEYDVAGTAYTGSTAYFGDRLWQSGASSLDARMNRLRREGAVPVYFDPGDPGRSVLEPGVHWQALAVVSMGLVVVLLGVGQIMGNLTPPAS